MIPCKTCVVKAYRKYLRLYSIADKTLLLWALELLHQARFIPSKHNYSHFLPNYSYKVLVIDSKILFRAWGVNTKRFHMMPYSKALRTLSVSFLMLIHGFLSADQHTILRASNQVIGLLFSAQNQQSFS